MWTAVRGVTVPAVAMGVALAWSGCVATAADCAASDERCAGGAIEICRAHPAGTDVSADPLSVSHHKSSPNTWEPAGSCGAPDLCKTEATRDEYGVPKTRAFCTLDPAPDRACADKGAEGACDGTTSVSCHAGYALARQACKSCDATGRCTGGLYGACASAADCAPGLTCDAQNGCLMPCACPEGARCTSCDVLEQDTQGPTRPTTFTWVCRAGTCAPRF